MTNSTMTYKQEQIFFFISKYSEANGRPPVLRLISEELDIGISTVAQQVDSIIKQGYLTRTIPNIKQGMKLTAKGRAL